MTLHDTRAPVADRPLDHVDFGPGIGPDLERRLVGEPGGKRILELGCGAGHAAVGLARRGARVIAVDADVAQLAAARTLALRHEVTIEFHQARPAELAFLAADRIDLALSITSLSLQPDLDRVFRQVHRVVRPAGHFVVAVPHPGALCADPDDPDRLVTDWDHREPLGDRFVHTAEEIVTSLGRANFAVDTLLERRDAARLPATLVVRARKLGV